MPNTTIAVDLAKNVFEVAVANTTGGVPRRHRFTRVQFDPFLRSQAPAHVVMEACGTAHHWGRVAQAAGHRVSLLPAQYVRPFVRRQKTDRSDAAGLLDAVRSEGLKPVVVKTVAQQELLALHRIRDQWMKTRTARINALRGLLREHGVAVPSGARRGLVAVGQILADPEAPVPGCLRRALGLLVAEVREVEARIAVIERELRAIADQDPVVGRLVEIPGVGLLTATALVATVTHIHGFHRGRQFASWLGLTPPAATSAAA